MVVAVPRGAFVIAAGESVRITGEVTALGGDGGGGGRPGPGMPVYIYPGFGAGGGGGAGGDILLQGVESAMGRVLALGGANRRVPIFDPARAPADARTRLTRLLQDRPHNGNIQIDGTDVTTMAAPAAYRGPDLLYLSELVSPAQTTTILVNLGDPQQVRVSTGKAIRRSFQSRPVHVRSRCSSTPGSTTSASKPRMHHCSFELRYGCGRSCASRESCPRLGLPARSRRPPTRYQPNVLSIS